ncbi:MAG: DoxX family protein [Nocardioides sp.]|nr:DoxX family protein [Nocardioides sp.]
MARSGPGSAAAGWGQLLARLAVGGVWVYAGLLKLPDPVASIESVRAYELLPASFVEPVGYLLPPLEVVLGVALVLGVMTRGAAVLSAVVLLAFTIGIASAWARGLEIDCGCFGDGGANPDATLQYPWELLRDVTLGVLSAWLVVARERRWALDSLLFRSSSPVTMDGDQHDLDDHADGPPVGDRTGGPA